MAAPKKDRRKAELARIHILKAQLRLDDDVYRDVLWVNGQVKTSAELDTHGRIQVIKHLDGLRRRMKPGADAYAGRPRNADTDARAELLKIEALLTDAALPWSYALAILKRQTNGRVERLEFADGAARAAVIAALDKAARKRLYGELQAIWGDEWPWHAGGFARALFDFPSSQNITKHTDAMSRVLRWWRGDIEAACPWPRTAQHARALCVWCAGQLRTRASA
ncbi:phage protein GemA/Gp16 family protein [Hydrocarboniphaga effusa]|uniref:phage protein GemA/Gp16 family protein n=1 Tax=Hydrocarboniphaga effusa TaxID=243629 RepID=UPI003BAABA17